MPNSRLMLAVLTITFATTTPAAQPTAELPLFEGLGHFSRPISCTATDVKAYFNQGLAFMYAFNHDEALRAFRKATELEPACAVAWWGVAIAHGPHINNPVVTPEQASAATAAVDKARQLAGSASAVEQALIRALLNRYADPQPEDRSTLDQGYADAMAKVWMAYPEDGDVGALYAESLADLHPWNQWNAAGEAQPGTAELLRVLETVLQRDPQHPLANHLYIHAVEASPEPGRADQAADRLRELQPGLGHMVHMPSHIDVRRGRWHEAVVANAKAMAADSRYTELSPGQGFYRLYMAHNFHMLSYAAMMTGQSQLALQTIRDMVAGIPAEFFRDNAFADGMMVMPMEVMMRFGMWENILAEPDYPQYVPLSRALRHYARAVAHAARNEIAQAKAEQSAFAAARKLVPAESSFGNNTGSALLDVAEELMKGEILYRDGSKEAGLAALREAVRREDSLRYDEPPGWIQPVRHPLGAALLQAGLFSEAEAVFRADLKKLPNNGWGLYGLFRALELQGHKQEAQAVSRQFDAAWKDADIQIRSPCLCLPGV